MGYEKTMVLDCTVGDCGHSAVYLHRRRSRHASLELAAAPTLWLAHADVLASAGLAGAVPDPLRRTRRPSSWTRPKPAVGRTLQEDDAGGAGKIPAGDERRLRRWGLRPRERQALRLGGGDGSLLWYPSSPSELPSLIC